MGTSTILTWPACQRAFIQALDADEVLLSGAVGCGHSTVVAALVARAYQEGQRVFFVVSNSLRDRLKATNDLVTKAMGRPGGFHVCGPHVFSDPKSYERPPQGMDLLVVENVGLDRYAYESALGWWEKKKPRNRPRLVAAGHVGAPDHPAALRAEALRTGAASQRHRAFLWEPTGPWDQDAVPAQEDAP